MTFTMLRESVLSVVFFIIMQHTDVFDKIRSLSVGVYASTENSYERLAMDRV